MDEEDWTPDTDIVRMDYVARLVADGNWTEAEATDAFNRWYYRAQEEAYEDGWREGYRQGRGIH